MALEAGSHLGPYRVAALIGAGGMGEVYRATDTRLGREVAIKEIHLPVGLSRDDRDNARARMVREAQTAARISHPSVVTVHDVAFLRVVHVRTFHPERRRRRHLVPDFHWQFGDKRLGRDFGKQHIDGAVDACPIGAL